MLNDGQKLAVEKLIRSVGDNCIYPYFNKLRDVDVSFKASELDLVTVADKEAEKLLHDGLLSILPVSLFEGEELFEERPEILEHLGQRNLPIWVVDPIDGTDNFVAGQAGFGIMVCLVLAGETLSSWFYEIPTSKLTVFHSGYPVTVDGAPLKQVGDCKKPYTGQIGKKLYQFPEVRQIEQTSIDIEFLPVSQPSIVTYHWMLTGDLDFLVFKITYPWDHLPGIALVADRGALVSRWSGQPFQVSDIHEGLIVARNQEVLSLVLEQITKPLSRSKEIVNMKSFRS